MPALVVVVIQPKIRRSHPRTALGIKFYIGDKIVLYAFVFCIVKRPAIIMEGFAHELKRQQQKQTDKTIYACPLIPLMTQR